MVKHYTFTFVTSFILCHRTDTPLCRFYVCICMYVAGKVPRPFNVDCRTVSFSCSTIPSQQILRWSERQKSSTFHNYVTCFAIKISCILGVLLASPCRMFFTRWTTSTYEIRIKKWHRERKMRCCVCWNSTKLIIILKGKLHVLFDKKREHRIWCTVITRP